MFDDVTLNRFWSKVDKTPGHGPNGDCWLWTAAKGNNGQGQFWLDGDHVIAYRFSWALANNHAVPEGKFVCHTCDDPRCVNPAHLWIGTNSENMIDCRDKGRRAVPASICGNGHEMVGYNVGKDHRGWRFCRQCKAGVLRRLRARRAAMRAARPASSRSEKE